MQVKKEAPASVAQGNLLFPERSTGLFLCSASERTGRELAYSYA